MPHIGEEHAFLSGPPVIQSVVPGVSPYTYVAPDSGNVTIQAGTVTLIELGRLGTFVTTGLTLGIIPVARGDQIRITYAVAPTMNFFRK